VLRYHAPGLQTALPLARRAPAETLAWRRTEEILRQAASRDAITGADWEDLTVLVATGSRFSYGTSDLWTAACHRLLDEVMMSDGVSWMRRFEAFNRLLAHPVLGLEALSVVRDVVADRSVQSLVGTACMLDSTSRSESAVQVIRLLRSPDDDRVFKGSLMACVRKIDYGHFSARQLTVISGILGDALNDAMNDPHGSGTLGAETLALASSVLRQIPPHLHHPRTRAVQRRLGDAGIGPPSLPGAGPSLPPEHVTRATAQRLSNRAMASLATPATDYVDRVLPRLVEEMLFHPVFDVRLYAAALIHASPYRTTMARGLAEELSATWRSGDEMWLTTLLEALRKLGGHRERRTVEKLVLHPSAPATVADVAAYALGHIGGGSPLEFWLQAVERHVTAWHATRQQAHASVLDRLVYALGMGSRRDVLATLRRDRRVPPLVRRSANWWLDRSAPL
jgi:hypothetical protein